MVASFEVFLDTIGSVGAPGAATSTDALGPPNIRYKRADNAIIDTLNPNIIPTTGTSFSRWKSQYIQCTVAPDTQVDNITIFTDGAGFGTGITVVVGDETPTKNSGSDAGYDPADTDDDPLTNHAGITATTDFFTFTSGSPKSISISEAGSLIDAIGETSDYLITQMEVINTASPGDLADETVTYEYDEI